MGPSLKSTEVCFRSMPSITELLIWAKTWVPAELWDKPFGGWDGATLQKFLAGPSRLESAVDNLLKEEDE